LTSCEPVYEAVIINETKNDVILQLTFDKKELEKAWGDSLYLGLLNSYPNTPTIDRINKDTINLIYSYSIKPQGIFPFGSGIGYKPDFDSVKEILILKPDTLLLRSKAEMSKAFDEIDTRDFV